MLHMAHGASLGCVLHMPSVLNQACALIQACGDQSVDSVQTSPAHWNWGWSDMSTVCSRHLRLALHVVCIGTSLYTLHVVCASPSLLQHTGLVWGPHGIQHLCQISPTCCLCHAGLIRRPDLDQLQISHVGLL